MSYKREVKVVLSMKEVETIQLGEFASGVEVGRTQLTRELLLYIKGGALASPLSGEVQDERLKELVAFLEPVRKAEQVNRARPMACPHPEANPYEEPGRVV